MKRSYNTTSNNSKKAKKDQEISNIMDEAASSSEPEIDQSETDSQESSTEVSEASNTSSHQKNRKKLFWLVPTKSLQYDANDQQDITTLLNNADENGEFSSQYCSLGLYIEQVNEDISLVWNIRYKNLIATFGNVKEVVLYQVIDTESGKKVIKMECSPSSNKKWFTSKKDLVNSNGDLSTFAWKITYHDESFDFHLMTCKTNKTERAIGSYKHFTDHFATEKFMMRSEIPNMKRPRKFGQAVLMEIVHSLTNERKQEIFLHTAKQLLFLSSNQII